MLNSLKLSPVKYLILLNTFCTLIKSPRRKAFLSKSNLKRTYNHQKVKRVICDDYVLRQFHIAYMHGFICGSGTSCNWTQDNQAVENVLLGRIFTVHASRRTNEKVNHIHS